MEKLPDSAAADDIGQWVVVHCKDIGDAPWRVLGRLERFGHVGATVRNSYVEGPNGPIEVSHGGRQLIPIRVVQSLHYLGHLDAPPISVLNTPKAPPKVPVDVEAIRRLRTEAESDQRRQQSELAMRHGGG